MRAIGTVTNEFQARRLSDYLLTLGIASQMEPVSDGFCVWIHDEDRVDLGRKEVTAFLQDPDNPRYQSAQPLATLLRHQNELAERKYRKNLKDITQRWGRPSPANCPLTILLIALSIMVAVASRMGDRERIKPVLNYLFITQVGVEGQMVSWLPSLPEIRRGQVWRLITPILIHFGPMHLLFNLWCLYNLGGVIEIQRGTWRLAVLVLFSAVVSNLAQFYWSGPLFGGMSGVIYTLFGYAWMKSRYDPAAGLYIPRDTVTLMIVWLFLCMTGLMGSIANVAHVTGLLTGVVLGLALVWWKRHF